MEGIQIKNNHSMHKKKKRNAVLLYFLDILKAFVSNRLYTVTETSPGKPVTRFSGRTQ